MTPKSKKRKPKSRKGPTPKSTYVPNLFKPNPEQHARFVEAMEVPALTVDEYDARYERRT